MSRRSRKVPSAKEGDGAGEGEELAHMQFRLTSFHHQLTSYQKDLETAIEKRKEQQVSCSRFWR